MTIAFLSVLVAALICGTPPSLTPVIAACLAAALITAAANAVNDYFDVDIDRINRPERPIPSGQVGRNEALSFSIVFFLGAIAVALKIHGAAVLTAVFFSLLLVAYSAKFKRTVLIGNVIVSLSTAAAFIFGGLAVGSVRAAIFPALFAFLMHLSREVIKDIEDMRGDHSQGAVTLPIRHGVKAAITVTVVLLTMLIAATIVPAALGIYGRWYLLIVAAVDAVLIGVMVKLLRQVDHNDFGKLSAVLKADMVLGLLAIYAGRW